MVFTGIMSFFKYNTLSNESSFIGFENYKNMFSDSMFWTALRNTLFFTIGTVPVTTLIALLLANLLNSNLVKHKNFFRSSFFSPAIISLVVISLIFTNLYAQDVYINFLLKTLGLPHRIAVGYVSQDFFACYYENGYWSSCGYY